MDTSKPINPSDLFSAKGLTVVITGGGSGIGLAFATSLAGSGAEKVYLLGRRVKNLEDAAKSINPDIIVPIQCDVTDQSSIDAAVKQIEKQSSHIDVLINNAGVLGPDHKGISDAQSIQELQEIMKRDWSGWDTSFQTNTSAIVSVSAAFLHLLDAGNKKRGWATGRREVQERVEGGDSSDPRSSQIITVASIASFNRFVTAGLAYSATKAGAAMLGKALATLLAPFNIRSNIIAPGRECIHADMVAVWWTNMTSGFPSDMTAGDTGSFPVTQIPASRSGSYEDMASMILFLVGKSGAYHNGNVQVIDGGRLSMMPSTY
ncbi:NAD(P)-binding protein [Aureobasidium pullulans]|nr:NAD(P)-binding protein [Aureobasidium pullulans]